MIRGHRGGGGGGLNNFRIGFFVGVGGYYSMI